MPPAAPRARRCAALLPLLALAPVEVGCEAGAEPPAPASAPASAARPTPAERPSPAGAPAAGPPPPSWVERRAAAADDRLAQSAGGRRVARAIAAHGGLRPWLAAGTIAFTFDYVPVDAPDRRMHTRQRVDLWRARAVHEELGEGADARFGWDGEVAWIIPGPEAFPAPARFWALTPYYFLGMPFVLGDPGLRFEVLPDATLDGRAFEMVKVTFDEGTGDAPGDYYVLYLDPETHRLHALRYVVSYPGFAGRRFEPGGHTPETLMRLSGPVEVDGLRFPTRLDTFTWDAAAGAPIAPRARVTAGELTLGRPVPGAAFAPPAGAHATSAL